MALCFIILGMVFLASINPSRNHDQWKVWWASVPMAVTSPATTPTTFLFTTPAVSITQPTDAPSHPQHHAMASVVASTSPRSMRSESIRSYQRRAIWTSSMRSPQTGPRNMLLYVVHSCSFIRMTETHWNEVLSIYPPLKSFTMKNNSKCLRY